MRGRRLLRMGSILRRKGYTALLVAAALGAVVLPGGGAVASDAPTPITLQTGGVEVQGVTMGTESLTRMASRDLRRKLCLGYAAEAPNHVVILPEIRPHLRIAVDSKGEDTTLFIQGPEGIYCNDNASRAHRDAAVTARSWPAGTYRIWVGAFNRGDELEYTLSISDPRLSVTRR